MWFPADKNTFLQFPLTFCALTERVEATLAQQLIRINSLEVCQLNTVSASAVIVAKLICSFQETSPEIIRDVQTRKIKLCLSFSCFINSSTSIFIPLLLHVSVLNHSSSNSPIVANLFKTKCPLLYECILENRALTQFTNVLFPH